MFVPGASKETVKFGKLLQRKGQAGLLAVGGRARDGADLHRLVERRVDPGKELRGIFLFAGGHGGAELFLGAAQAGLHGAVLELLALAIPHPAFG